VFAEGLSRSRLTGSQHTLNVITDVPVRPPLAWHGIDLLAGNAYVLTGLARLLALFG